MYALDLEALHASVKRRGRGIARGVNAMEIGTIVICIVVAAVLGAEPILEGVDRHQFFAVGLLLAVAAYLLVGRIRRRNREHAFEPSLLGDLDRALSQVDYHIARIRTFPWWFFLPTVLILSVSFVQSHGSKPIWTWLVLFASAAVSLYVVRLELRCVHLPRKRDLEALRAKLTTDG